MWEPVFYARNSGDLVKDRTGELVGGLSWYIPSEVHDHHTPLGHVGSLLSGVETLPSNMMPPWIMQVRDSKVFVGERLDLSARLNVNGERHSHALNDQRAIPYAFGFIGEAGKDRIPSYDDMKAMSASWRDEIGRLLNILNEDVAESFLNRSYLKSFAKKMHELVPAGLEIGAKYGENLWDQRAQQVNSGQKLDRPVLVNAYELAPRRNWEAYPEFEIDGVGSKKKNLRPHSNSLERGLESKLGNLEETLGESLNTCHPLSGRQVIMASATSLAIGSMVGIWVFNHQHRKSQTSQVAIPAEQRSL